MKKVYLIIVLDLLIFVSTGIAQVSVKLINIKGDVKVRYGLEENWKSASAGIYLKDMDSILSGEGSTAVLQLKSGDLFTLGSNSVLDISDLRKIYENELFLFLMSKKVEQIEKNAEKTPLQIGNVSVVRGESKSDSISHSIQINTSKWVELEINGALSLYNQNYFPNTVVKLHKVLDLYESYGDCGKIHFYIARSLESLEMKGQAIEAYQSVIDIYNDQQCENLDSERRLEKSRLAIDNLKKK
jgi:hypothetical protein